MKISTFLCGGVIAATSILFGACTTQSGPTYSIRAVNLPNKPGAAFRVTCEGLLSSTRQCESAAQDFCANQGITVLQAIDRVADNEPKLDPRALTFICGVPKPAPVSRQVPQPQPQLRPQPQPQPQPQPPKPVVKRQVLLQGGANFAFDSAMLLPDARARLSRFVEINRGNAFNRVTVVGHTDSTGMPAHNLKLSVARAQSVVSYLQDAGLNAQSFSAQGAGSAEPVASNKTEEGRALNRRVEIHIEQ
ncbi:OmpA family protein [Burkholderia sp. Ac-20379]|uniref:OmpA family protein n=1 Tax=Burkholderia sp. Ac-20379 TaxID=2703900 RepID=UPI00197F3DF9|nr:OmpA family protein [Burkholderia sp. Ac-20379]MBN3723458.1 OmpA family protein [Burkholderia sp. Ac-20379]